jgi:hypothetical protein
MVDRFRRVIKRKQRNPLLSCGLFCQDLQLIPTGTTESAMGNRFQVQDRYADGAQYIGGRLRARHLRTDAGHRESGDR